MKVRYAKIPVGNGLPRCRIRITSQPYPDEVYVSRFIPSSKRWSKRRYLVKVADIEVVEIEPKPKPPVAKRVLRTRCFVGGSIRLKLDHGYTHAMNESGDVFPIRKLREDGVGAGGLDEALFVFGRCIGQGYAAIEKPTTQP
jgi:hypothetical protein